MEYRPVILTLNQEKRLDEMKQLLITYKKILGLGEENIEIGISAKNTAYIFWYEERKTWGIYLLPSDNDFTPIHELGHIFLAKKTNYPYFARSGIKRSKIYEGLLMIVNNIVDCFVDYNLIQFEHLYDLYIEDAHLWKNAKKKGKIKGVPIDLVHSYKTLIAIYLSLKIIDKEKNRRYFIDVKNYLRKAKQLIQKTYSNRKFNFQSLERELDHFDKIKDTKDPKIIVNFCYMILCEISLWKIRDIQQQIKLFFPED